MQKPPRQVSTPEYRAQAVRLVTEQKKSVPQAARELGMSAKTLANWVYKARGGSDVHDIAPTTDRARGRDESAQARIGGSKEGARYRIIALAYFAREPR